MRTTPEVHAVVEETANRSNFAESCTYRLPLPPHPIAAEQARILVRLALAAWDMDDIADDALIIATELVTNAAKCGGVFPIIVSRQDGAVLIEVSDSSEASPDPQQRSLDRVDGRGLLLVQAYAKDWGWRLDEAGGKTVWALAGNQNAAPSAGAITPPPAVQL